MDGSISLNPQGGSDPYMVSWIPVTPASTPNELSAGVYNYTITDANGCTAVGEIEITEPDEILLNMSSTDVSCGGFADGTAGVSASGGTNISDYQYRWDDANNSTSSNISGLSGGWYTVTVTDDNACEKIDSVFVDEDAPLQIIPISINGIDCFGEATGSITVNVVGGDGNYTYGWTGGSGLSGNSVAALEAGEYVLTVEDGAGCSTSTTFNIDQPDELIATMTTTGTSGVGQNDGTATVTVAGGSFPYSYMWNPGGMQDSMRAGLSAGLYEVTITDANGCTTTTEGEVLDFDCPQITANTVVTAVTCNGGNDGTVSIQPGGGTAPYEVDWIPNDPETAPNMLSAGTYSYTITDASGCNESGEILIEEPSAIVLTLSSTIESCGGAADGTASVEVTGGVGNYQYAWNAGNGSSTDMISDLMAGTYTVTVSDGNGCEKIDSVVVDQESSVEISLVSLSHVDCFDGNNGMLEIEATGGSGNYDITWEGGTGLAGTTLTDLTAGTYSVTVDDGSGCPAMASYEIIQPDELVAIMNTTNTTGVGQNDGTATVVVTGGTGSYTFDWTPGGLLDSVRMGLSSGIYEVTVTDENGCTTTTEGEVLDFDCPDITVQANVEEPACFGDQTGSIDLVISGGDMPYEITWSPAGINPSALGAGTYAYTVTDANGCTAEGESTINEPEALSHTQTVSPESFAGAADGAISIAGQGGTPPYQYQWQNPLGTDPNLMGLSAGVYAVTITDGNSCTYTTEVEVEVGVVDCTTFDPTLSSTDVLCNGDSTGTARWSTAGLIMPLSFEWSSNPADTFGLIVGQPAGTYSTTITDGRGCTSVQEISIEEPAAIILASAATDESANGANDGSVVTTPSGGTPPYNYLWSTADTDSTISNLGPGIYTVFVSDANGCNIRDTVEVGAGPVDCTLLQGSLDVDDVRCFGESNGSISVATVTGTPPYSYIWSTTDTTSSISGLPNGDYFVVITDANDCVIQLWETVNQPDSIEIMISSTDETGAGLNDGTATAVASGGTGTLTYDWSDMLGSNPMVGGLAPGSYTVTVTDENNCVEIADVVIRPGDVDCTQLVSETSKEDVSCFGAEDGTASVLPDGGQPPYVVEWPGNQSGLSIDGLAAGTYEATITDDFGCVRIEVFEIEEPDPIVVSVSKTDETITGLNDGTAQAVPVGGNGGYRYTWSHGPTSSEVTDLPPGVYEVIVTDSRGCTGSQTIEIFEGQPDCRNLEAIVDTEDVSCFGFGDGRIEVSGRGGMGPYTIEWLDGSTDLVREDLSPGTYAFVLTDANDCQVNQGVMIEGPDPLVVVVTGTSESVAGANDGTAKANVAGGTMPYMYRWDGGETTDSISNQAPGVKSVTVTDANGCEIEGSFDLPLGPPDCSTAEVILDVTNVSCPGGADGRITTQLQGLTGQLFILWDNNQEDPEITGLSAGIYCVTVTDDRGCTAESCAEVTEPDAFDLRINGVGGNCGALGTATLTLSGGTPPYNYLWSNGDMDTRASGLPDGQASVTITDARGCETEGGITIQNSDNEGVDVIASKEDILCAGEANGEIFLEITRGVAPYKILWNTGDTLPVLTGLAAGTYTVEIEDAEGCNWISAFVVNEPSEIRSNFAVSNPTSQTSSNGSIIANPSGGRPPYQYVWNNGMTGPAITDLRVGTYFLTITDGNGCIHRDSVVLDLVSSVNDIRNLVFLDLSPNPTNQQSTIMARFSSPEQYDLVIYNIVGQPIYRKSGFGQDIVEVMDLADYSSGTYLVRLKTKDGQVVRRLLKL